MQQCQLWKSLWTLSAGPAAILQRVTDNIIVAVSEPRLHLADAAALFSGL